MSMPARALGVAEAAASVLAEVLGSRLRSVIAHGSAVTGDIVVPYSDLDLMVIAEEASVADAIAMHEVARSIDRAPFSFIQAAIFDPAKVDRLLVHGAHHVVIGPMPPDSYFQRGDEIVKNGEEWLAELPRLLRGDAEGWSLATAEQTPRFARLLLTRVKPAVRALVSRDHADPDHVWSMSWDDLVAALRDRHATIADSIASLLTAARTSPLDHDVVGRRAIESLTAIVELGGRKDLTILRGRG